MTVVYIESQDTLATACDALQSQPWIAIDTEFSRERTYYAKLCLIQIASSDQVILIDPLKLESLEPLNAILTNPNILKVFHAAYQDLEIFYTLFGQLPGPLFDTQLAAALLGLGNQTGYANLVYEIMGVSLNKSQTRTDWSKRPLSDKQIEYAIDDVRYLFQLYPKIDAQLTSLGRRDWLQADLEKLSDSRSFEIDQDKLWCKVKGYQRLSGIQLAILKQLATWREGLAQKQDRPRKHVLRDDILISLARLKPESREAIASIPNLLRSLSNSLIDEVIAINKQVLKSSKDEWPVLPSYTRLSKQEEILADALMIVLKWAAKKHHLSSEIIATRKDIEKLILDKDTQPIMQGWRFDYAGKYLSDFLQGKAQLRAIQGKLELAY